MFIFSKQRRERRADDHPARRPQYTGRLSAACLDGIFAGCADYAHQSVRLGGAEGRVNGTLCYLDGLVDGAAVSDEVLRPLTEATRFGAARSAREAARLLAESGAWFYSVRIREELDDVVEDLLAGWSVLVFDGLAVSFETKSGKGRSIEAPQAEKPLKAARDSFVELFRTNTALLRRRIRSADLKLEETSVGRRTKTKVALVYLEGLTDPQTVAQVRRRLADMDVDGLLTAGTLETALLDRGSVFPQINHTERPDRFAMELLEGRTGVLVEGIPLGFLLPANLSEQLRVPEDQAGHFIVASLLTLLRYLGMLVSVLVPAGYVAVTMYHQEMIPTKLLLSIIQSKQNVPFSTAAEVLSLLLAFELLQEAGLRLPESIGQTVSIIGALIVGQSAVEAKVISPVVVIVVAVAGITGYTMPNQDLAAALRLCRFGMALLSLWLGLFGMVVGGLLLVYALSTLENCGTPYLAPFCDGSLTEALKAVTRFPLRSQKYRAGYLHPQNVRAQK